MFAAACTTSAPTAGEPTYDSVRERMTDRPERLWVGTEGSTGSVTARRWTPSGWIEGITPLVITNGEMVGHLDNRGTLKLDKLEVAVGPIDIPEEVFNKPAQLVDVKVVLASTVSGETQWNGDDEASAKLTLMLDLEWSIAINGGKTPLGAQHLPPIDVIVTLAGGGDHVDATIALAANGKLWNWAGLLELTGIELAVSAATLD